MSCSTQKPLTQTKEASEKNNEVTIEVDSMSRHVVEEQEERLMNRLEEKKTTLILFDSDKPAVDSTGLPPVKAIARQEIKREEVERVDGRKKEQIESELKEETIDKKREVHSQYVEIEQKTSWWRDAKNQAMCIMSVLVLIILIYGLYKLIKFFK